MTQKKRRTKQWTEDRLAQDAERAAQRILNVIASMPGWKGPPCPVHEPRKAAAMIGHAGIQATSAYEPRGLVPDQSVRWRFYLVEMLSEIIMHVDHEDDEQPQEDDEQPQGFVPPTFPPPGFDPAFR